MTVVIVADALSHHTRAAREAVQRELAARGHKVLVVDAGAVERADLMCPTYFDLLSKAIKEREAA